MNETIFLFLYTFAHKSSAFDAAIVFLAQDFVWVILAVTFFYLLKNKDKHVAFRDVGVYFATAVIAVIVSTVLKELFHTARPFIQLSSIQPLITETGFAFPSGHTTLVISIAAFLWTDHRWPAILVGLTGLIIGFSRIAAGIHWPIDIAGGLLLGWALGVGVYRLSRRLLPNV